MNKYETIKQNQQNELIKTTQTDFPGTQNQNQ